MGIRMSRYDVKYVICRKRPKTFYFIIFTTTGIVLQSVISRFCFNDRFYLILKHNYLTNYLWKVTCFFQQPLHMPNSNCISHEK